MEMSLRCMNSGVNWVTEGAQAVGKFDAEALIRAMDALMDNGEVVEDALAR